MNRWVTMLNIGGENLCELEKFDTDAKSTEELVSRLGERVLVVHNEGFVDKNDKTDVTRAEVAALIAIFNLALVLAMESDNPRFDSVVAIECPADNPSLVKMKEHAAQFMNFDEAKAFAKQLSVSEEGIEKYRELFYCGYYNVKAEKIRNRIENCAGNFGNLRQTASSLLSPILDNGDTAGLTNADVFFGIVPHPEIKFTPEVRATYIRVNIPIYKMGIDEEVSLLREIDRGWEHLLRYKNRYLVDLAGIAETRKLTAEDVIKCMNLPVDVLAEYAGKAGIPLEGIMA